MKNPLLDMEFLNKLHNERQRDIYARITLLTQNELPIEYIEGKITAGSVSIDGNSALRRTCNLTMTLKDQSEINEFYWTFKSKFKLEVGIINNINNQYPDIIWFPQGIFILTTCNMNQTTNNYTITINGKDKMCKLNGDLGGIIMAPTDFGTIKEVDANGDITYTKLLLKDIIREMLINQGEELDENIIINDLDEAGLELLEYRCEDKSLYLFRRVDDGTVENVTLNDNMEVRNINSGSNIALKELNSYREMDGLILNNEEATKVYLLDESGNPVCENNIPIQYQVMRYKYGDLAGYRLTPLTYAGELKANAGESIVSVLDKIKKMLGEFEYFYNLDGRFIFQRKRNYISTPWNATETDENNFFNETIKDSYPQINLMNAKLTTTFANNPNLLNAKNDFSVWGTYKSVSSGADIPIHMRYAIDKKPVSYKPIRPLKEIIKHYSSTEDTTELTCYATDEKLYDAFNYNAIFEGSVIKGQEYNIGNGVYRDDIIPYYATEDQLSDCDWRELIYQMALDYYKCRTDDDFKEKMIAANPWTAPSGRTGYEQYYTDMQGFWRQLYNPDPESIFEEIEAKDISSSDKTIYLEEAYVQLISKEVQTLKDYLDNQENITDDEFNELIDNLYVKVRIKTIDEQNKEKYKDTLYPFIGSKYCCLEEDNKYFYMKNNEFTSSNQMEVLNAIPLKSIYEEIRSTKVAVVKNRLATFLDNMGINNIVLWKKGTKKLELPKGKNTDYFYCQNILYSSEDSVDGEFQGYYQHMYNWSIDNNYGKLSTNKETTYKFTYLIEDAYGNYLENCWHRAVKENPEQLIFWFDFLDAEGSDLFDKYSIRAIGDRTKAVNDSNVKSMYYREVPNIIFVQNLVDNTYDRQSGYTYIYISPIYQSLFNISGRGKSAKEAIDELLQQHSYCIEATTITTVPLYHLEPNTIICVKDEISKVNGEYMVNKVTIPFAYNGTMSLTANKIVSNIM